MERESVGSVRLRSDRYPSSLFSSSGSGGFSVSSCEVDRAAGAGLSLLTVVPSVLPPPSEGTTKDEASSSEKIVNISHFKFLKRFITFR